ncbi:malonyl-CoA decarboxylase family protein [uncultured Tateyamaria sp.]|uniref:malonyl-CoA decarboxylase domain-containing protein n=1 Tax=Tateyamaria sp. 1078 TaxID=3417464 RepID=UPI0026340425|nr:malonyl-CoA decarboxylase family protein [uncultured Tateyamaria sp.]
MQRNWFLGDLLTQLFERRDRARGKDDTRPLPALCDALLSTEGELSGVQLAATLLDRYASANDADKLAFFEYLNTALEIDAAHLAALARTYAEAPRTDLFRDLSRAAEPRRQELLRRLNQPVGATAALVAMRVDLLRFVRDHPDLARTDFDFVHLLRSWFNPGFLVLKAINWDTPARILDKIVAYEAVHRIGDLDDLRRRLYPEDRRCFAFFHPSMPDEPLIFVEVALTADIPGSIDALLLDGRTPLATEAARVAVFYSISNCQSGLTGISFGNLLIKQVAAELARDVPGLERFVTLSPIPRLNQWLATQTDDPEHGQAAQDVLGGTASEAVLRAMAARYLMTAKRADGTPFDPVARFHLGNGAEIHDLHANADTSANGHAQSSGVMVNYLYDLAQTGPNHARFALHGDVAATKAMRTLANAPLTQTSKEEPA